MLSVEQVCKAVKVAVGGNWMPVHRRGIWSQEPVVLSVLQLRGHTSCCVTETGFSKQASGIGSFSSLCHHKSLILCACVCLGFFLFPLKGTNCSDTGHCKSIKWLEGRQSHIGQRKQSVGDGAELGPQSVLGGAAVVWKETQMFLRLSEFVSHWAVTCWHF